MKYYHACTENTAKQIINDGKFKVNNWEGIVYLADSAVNAAKFLVVRHPGEPITVFEIDNLDETKIEEQFDHSASFFQCKAYGYCENIPITNVTNMYTVGQAGE